MTKQEKEKFLTLIDQYIANLGAQMRDSLSQDFMQTQARLELYLSGDTEALRDVTWSLGRAMDDVRKKIDVMREFRRLIEKFPVAGEDRVEDFFKRQNT